MFKEVIELEQLLTSKKTSLSHTFFKTTRQPQSNWYSDEDIFTYINTVILYDLGGYASDDHKFLLKSPNEEGQFIDGNHSYYVAVLPAIDSTGVGIPLEFFFDKSTQRQPEQGYPDDRKDVFEELSPLLTSDSECRIKIFFSYNTVHLHWTTGEILLFKKADQRFVINVFIHDPCGEGLMPEREFEKIQKVVRKRINAICPKSDFIVFENKSSPYKTHRQSEGDAISCGVIEAEELIDRILGKSLDRNSPYSYSAIELRQKHLDLIKAKLGAHDQQYIQFAKHKINVQEVNYNDAQWESSSKEAHAAAMFAFSAECKQLIDSLENNELRKQIQHAFLQYDPDNLIQYAANLKYVILTTPASLYSKGERLSINDVDCINKIYSLCFPERKRRYSKIKNPTLLALFNSNKKEGSQSLQLSQEFEKSEETYKPFPGIIPTEPVAASRMEDLAVHAVANNDLELLKLVVDPIPKAQFAEYLADQELLYCFQERVRPLITKIELLHPIKSKIDYYLINKQSGIVWEEMQEIIVESFEVTKKDLLSNYREELKNRHWPVRMRGEESSKATKEQIEELLKTYSDEIDHSIHFISKLLTSSKNFAVFMEQIRNHQIINDVESDYITRIKEEFTMGYCNKSEKMLRLFATSKQKLDDYVDNSSLSKDMDLISLNNLKEEIKVSKVNVDLLSTDYRSLLEIALQKSHHDIANFLRHLGAQVDYLGEAAIAAVYQNNIEFLTVVLDHEKALNKEREIIKSEIATIKKAMNQRGKKIDQKTKEVLNKQIVRLEFELDEISRKRENSNNKRKMLSEKVVKQKPLPVVFPGTANQIIERLFLTKVSVNVVDVDGNSLLHIAVRRARTDIAVMLFKLGANVRLQNGQNLTPLQIRDQKGNTFLHQLVSRKYKEIAYYLLLKESADCHLRNGDGKTPLDLQDDEGNTLLHYAIEDEVNYLKLHLSVKTHISSTCILHGTNCVDIRGITLHLLARGASIMTANQNKETPWQLILKNEGSKEGVIDDFIGLALSSISRRIIDYFETPTSSALQLFQPAPNSPAVQQSPRSLERRASRFEKDVLLRMEAQVRQIVANKQSLEGNPLLRFLKTIANYFDKGIMISPESLEAQIKLLRKYEKALVLSYVGEDEKAMIETIESTPLEGLGAEKYNKGMKQLVSRASTEVGYSFNTEKRKDEEEVKSEGKTDTQQTGELIKKSGMNILMPGNIEDKYWRQGGREEYIKTLEEKVGKLEKNDVESKEAYKKMMEEINKRTNEVNDLRDENKKLNDRMSNLERSWNQRKKRWSDEDWKEGEKSEKEPKNAFRT